VFVQAWRMAGERSHMEQFGADGQMCAGYASEGKNSKYGECYFNVNEEDAGSPDSVSRHRALYLSEASEAVDRTPSPPTPKARIHAAHSRQSSGTQQQVSGTSLQPSQLTLPPVTVTPWEPQQNHLTQMPNQQPDLSPQSRHGLWPGAASHWDQGIPMHEAQQMGGSSPWDQSRTSQPATFFPPVPAHQAPQRTVSCPGSMPPLPRQAAPGWIAGPSGTPTPSGYSNTANSQAMYDNLLYDLGHDRQNADSRSPLSLNSLLGALQARSSSPAVSQDSREAELPVLGAEHGGSSSAVCRTTSDGHYKPGDLLQQGALLSAEAAGCFFDGAAGSAQGPYFSERSNSDSVLIDDMPGMQGTGMCIGTSSNNSTSSTSGGASGSRGSSTALSFSSATDGSGSPMPPPMSYRDKLRLLGEQSLVDYRTQQAGRSGPLQQPCRNVAVPMGEAPRNSQMNLQPSCQWAAPAQNAVHPMIPCSSAPASGWAPDVGRFAPAAAPARHMAVPMSGPPPLPPAPPPRNGDGWRFDAPEWQAMDSSSTMHAPNIGSVRHHLRQCKPCAFANLKGCKDGAECRFCHLCESGEKKRRKKERSAVRRASTDWCQDDEWSESVMVRT